MVGIAYCWGLNGSGQLGTNGTNPSAVPLMAPTTNEWGSVAAGAGHTCATATGGLIKCWGDNTAGQLGGTGNPASPTIASLSWTDVAVGSAHSCALATTGAAYCWGKSDYGQVGDGAAAGVTVRSTPIAVAGAFAGILVGRYENNVYAQIGLVMLIGLSAKNAILIVEFAKMGYEEGKSLIEASLESARLRLRPILMTSFAFILGCVPLATASGAGALTLSWRDMLLARSKELQKSGKRMILLWMDGGPSQYDTFNPKPGSEYQGPAQAIHTNVPGIDIAEYWPKTAQVFDKIALIRSMVSDEKDHFRAIKLVRTGYPIKPTIAYPTWGSVVARERWDPGFDLPAFVRIGKPRIKTRDVNSGVLGPRYESFKIDEPGKLPADVHPTVSPDVLQRRLALAAKMDEQFAASGSRRAANEQREIYDRTSRFVLSPLLGAFNLDGEPEKLRDAYGRNAFGQGCLLARRLVEAGVRLVAVDVRWWDTHVKGYETMRDGFLSSS